MRVGLLPIITNKQSLNIVQSLFDCKAGPVLFTEREPPQASCGLGIVMKGKDIHGLFMFIQLAINACHNLITMDLTKSWEKNEHLIQIQVVHYYLYLDPMDLE